jgi:hypothetical protein
MSTTNFRAALDAHDGLVRDCAEGRLTFAEFLGAYGDFPRGYGLAEGTAGADGHEAVRLFRKRMAFHRQVAGVIAGLRRAPELGAPELGAPEESGVGDFLPVVGLRRLRELVTRYPGFEATAAESSAPRQV